MFWCFLDFETKTEPHDYSWRKLPAVSVGLGWSSMEKLTTPFDSSTPVPFGGPLWISRIRSPDLSLMEKIELQVSGDNSSNRFLERRKLERYDVSPKFSSMRETGSPTLVFFWPCKHTPTYLPTYTNFVFHPPFFTTKPSYSRGNKSTSLKRV